MFIHPHIADARPLLVVGLPRCGTRFVANALNRHPEIHINAEIPYKTMARALAFIGDIDEQYDALAEGRDADFSAGWRRSRRHLLYALWSGLVKREGASGPGRPVSWYGYKTPFHEQFWREYREILQGEGPKYVFCIRDFVGHYLGQDALGGKAMPKAARQYREGIARYAEMKRELGDDVSLFVLNDLKEGGRPYLRESLFERLGIEVDDATLERIDPAKPANSSASKSVPKRNLTRDERAFLEENRDLEHGLDAARAAKPLDQIATRR